MSTPKLYENKTQASHAPVDSQVYPFILMPQERVPLTAQLFFSLVGLHPAAVRASSCEELVGTKAVRNRCPLLHVN